MSRPAKASACVGGDAGVAQGEAAAAALLVRHLLGESVGQHRPQRVLRARRGHVDGPPGPAVERLRHGADTAGPDHPEQAGPPQDVDVVGHRALRLVESGGQLRDRGRPLEHQVQDGHAGSIPQSLELVRLIGHDHLGEVVVRDLVSRRERLSRNGRHLSNEPEIRSVCQATFVVKGPASLAMLTTPVGRAHGAATVAYGAPKEQPPRNLSGQRTDRVRRRWKAGGPPPHRRGKYRSGPRRPDRSRSSQVPRQRGNQPEDHRRGAHVADATHLGGARGPRRVRPPPHRSRRGPAGRHAVDDRGGGPRRVARCRSPRLHPRRGAPGPAVRTDGAGGPHVPAGAGRPEPGGDLAHRHGVLRHLHAAGHPAQPAREPGLVHRLHALPARDQPGPARSAPELPDDGRRPHGHGPGQRLDAGRGDGGRREHDDVSTAVQEPERHLRRAPGHPSPDDRRPPHAGRTGRHRPGGRRHRRPRRHRLLRCPPLLPHLVGCDPPPESVHGSRARGRRAGRGRRRPPGPRPAVVARRRGRRHRGRVVPAVRRADGLRWPPRGLPRHPRRVRPLVARPAGRRIHRRRRTPRTPAGSPDPGAAHPPREGDQQHLHRAGAPRQHRRDVRRVARTRRVDPHRRASPPPDEHPRRRVARRWPRPRQRHLVRHGAGARPRAGGGDRATRPGRPAST